MTLSTKDEIVKSDGPTPAIGDSVGRILEEMGLERVGACGTTAALALLNDAVKSLLKPLLRHIVLILADADGLWLDLYELGERILKPPRN